MLKKYTLFSFLFPLLFCACEKKLSPSQFAGKWQMVKVQLNGFEYEITDRQMFLVLGNSGSYWSLIKNKEEASGSWELLSSEKVLLLTENGGTPRKNHIRKITEDEMILYRETDKAEAFFKKFTK